MNEIPENKPPKPDDGREYLWDVDKMRWEAIEDNNASAEEAEKEEQDWSDHFFPKPPPFRNKSSLARMAKPKKIKRFLHAYNAYNGVVTMALKCSGLTRQELAELEKQEDFVSTLEEIKLQIADRTKYVLFERIGLIRAIPGMGKISENLLLQTAKAVNKDLFDGDTEGSVTVNLTLPRPERPTDQP